MTSSTIPHRDRHRHRRRAGGMRRGKNRAQLASDVAASKTTTIGVNAYLWKASLER